MTTTMVHGISRHSRYGESICGAFKKTADTVEHEVTSDLTRVNCPKCIPTVALELAGMLGAEIEGEEGAGGLVRYGYARGPFSEEGPAIYEDREQAAVSFLRRVFGNLAVFLKQAPDDRQQLLERIERLERDAMTRLYRREVGEGLLERLPRKRFGLLIMMDLDGLKALNTRGGHAEGDQAIQQMASAICGTLRAGDIGVRWGGDEFVIGLWLDGLGDPDDLGERMVERIRARLHASNDRLNFTAAWAVYTHQGSSYGCGLLTAVQTCSQSIIAQKEAARARREYRRTEGGLQWNT